VTGRHTDDGLARFTTLPEPDPIQDTARVLGDDPFGEEPLTDSFAEDLAARAPMRIANRTTVVLAGVLLVVVGFVGGVLVEKNSTSTTRATANPNGFGGNGPGGSGFGGGQGRGGGAGGIGGTAAGSPTTGKVTLVDGTTVYLTTADGQVLTIRTTGSTTVRAEQTMALKDLKAGTTVTVVGTTGGDGAVTATSVTAAR
jgi:hypothetical protein